MGRNLGTTELRTALSGWQTSVAVQLVRRVQEGADTANMHVEGRKKMNPRVPHVWRTTRTPAAVHRCTRGPAVGCTDLQGGLLS